MRTRRVRVRTCASFTHVYTCTHTCHLMHAHTPSQVDNIMRDSSSGVLPAAETQDLITLLQKEEGALVRFTLDSQGCLRSLFWATADQVISLLCMWHVHKRHAPHAVAPSALMADVSA